MLPPLVAEYRVQATPDWAPQIVRVQLTITSYSLDQTSVHAMQEAPNIDRWGSPTFCNHPCWARRAHLDAAAPADVSFEGLDVEVFDTDLAWLYNLVAALAHSPIQDAITREVAAQV